MLYAALRALEDAYGMPSTGWPSLALLRILVGEVAADISKVGTVRRRLHLQSAHMRAWQDHASKYGRW